MFIVIALLLLCTEGYVHLPDTNLDVTRLTEKLYNLDKSVGEFITINEDLNENGKYFLSVNESALESPTFQSFIQLRRHFTSKKCFHEDDTSLKIAAIENFINTLFDTEVMKMTEDFIDSKGILSITFRSHFEHLWFEQYSSCQQVNGSSGFEHVFVGETNEANVEGYHNWVSLYLDERASEIEVTRLLNYLQISEKVQAAAISFQWNNLLKPLSSLLIGSTPELEMSLYTLASLLNDNGTVTVSMNDVNFDVQTILKPNGLLIYTAYPIVP